VCRACRNDCLAGLHSGAGPGKRISKLPLQPFQRVRGAETTNQSIFVRMNFGFEYPLSPRMKGAEDGRASPNAALGAPMKNRARSVRFFCPSATKTYIIILRTATFLYGSSRTSSYLFALLAGKWTVGIFCEKRSYPVIMSTVSIKSVRSICVGCFSSELFLGTYFWIRHIHFRRQIRSAHQPFFAVY